MVNRENSMVMVTLFIPRDRMQRFTGIDKLTSQILLMDDTVSWVVSANPSVYELNNTSL